MTCITMVNNCNNCGLLNHFAKVFRKAQTRQNSQKLLKFENEEVANESVNNTDYCNMIHNSDYISSDDNGVAVLIND